MTDDDHPQPWTVETWEDGNGRSPFGKWYLKLHEYDQAIVDATIEHVLQPLGMDICETEWGKSLGEGLYELRIRASLNAILNRGASGDEQVSVPGGDKTVLLRIFCTFHGQRIVLLFQGYDKGKDSSDKRQQSEIKRARRHLKAWKKEK
jgi:putative component of toxin-antitoxin plasmid stabilization module